MVKDEHNNNMPILSFTHKTKNNIPPTRNHVSCLYRDTVHVHVHPIHKKVMMMNRRKVYLA